MNTLHTFGCSYTARFENNDNRAQYKEYKHFRGGVFPKIWSELLSQKLGLELNNTATGGASNYEIFQSFCDNIEKLKKNDVVVIGWSYKERFRLVDGTLKEFIRIGPGFNPSIPGISIDTPNEICVNRMNSKWAEEVYSWEKSIKKICELIGIKFIIWSFDYTFPEHYGFLDELKRLGAETITEETNGVVLDLHFGEMGHIVQCQYLYDVINDNISYNYNRKKLL
jgi:hypothetical protein